MNRFPILSHAATAAALSLLLLPGAVPAEARLRPVTPEYSFGVIKEIDGKAFGTVELVNDGDKPDLIHSVRVSCGCTEAGYDEQTALPGDTLRVSFSYNPAGRPGRFRKNIRVYGSDPEPATIVISGVVIGSPLTLSQSYPEEAGPLRLTEREPDMGNLSADRSRHVFVTLVNQSTTPLLLKTHSPHKAVSTAVTPDTLLPGDLGTVSLYLNARDERRRGALTYDVPLTATPVDGSAPPAETILTLRATILPDESDARATADGPWAECVPATVDLGEPERDGKIPFAFRIENHGKSDLHLNRLLPPDTADIEITQAPARIKPGRDAEVRGTLKPDATSPTPFRIPIEVMTDDPVHPVRTVTLVGNLN